MRETMIAGLSVGLLGAVLSIFGVNAMTEYREKAAAEARAAMQDEAPAPPAVEPWEVMAFRRLHKDRQLELALLLAADGEVRRHKPQNRHMKASEQLIGQVTLARIRTGYALEGSHDEARRRLLGIAHGALQQVEAMMGAEIKRKEAEQQAARERVATGAESAA